MTTPGFRIARGALDDIFAHAREAQPAECCGVLLGRDQAISEAVRVRNLSSDPNRYLMDPAGHITARRTARQRGLEVIGFYHSHPHSSPEPSPTDLAEASYPDHAYLIVSLRGDAEESAGSSQARLFRIAHEAASEMPLGVLERQEDPLMLEPGEPR